MAEDSKQFNNWVVACDNLRSCMAVGFPTKTDAVFIKIIRDATEDLPKVIVVADNRLLVVPGATLTLAFDYPTTPVIHTKFLSAGTNNSPVKATLSARETRAFMASLQRAKYLRIRVNILKATSGKQFKIDLSEVAKTLAYMDDKQHKDDVPTPIPPDSKQKVTVSTMPKTNLLIAQPIRIFDGKLPPLPAALASYKASHDCSDREAPATIFAHLSSTTELWGLCKEASNYNTIYAFFIVENGKAQPAHFAVPSGIPDLKGVLSNPSISKERVLNSFYKRNSTADCGVLGEWIWDSKQFQLLSYRKMDDCRGVFDHEDWPVLYRQQMQQ